MRAAHPLGRQTHGTLKSRSMWLTVVKLRGYANGRKIISIHKTSGCFHKTSEGSSYLAIIRGKRERAREMVNWPFPDGIAFNLYYRVLQGTRRLEKSDKAGSNATVNLHFCAYINKKGIHVLWSGSTWKGLCWCLYWSSVGEERFTYSLLTGCWLHLYRPWAQFWRNIIASYNIYSYTVERHAGYALLHMLQYWQTHLIERPRFSGIKTLDSHVSIYHHHLIKA